MKYLLILLLCYSIPGKSQTDFDKAVKLFTQAKYTDSRAIFESILKKETNNTSVLEYLGNIQGIQKNWDAALIYYNKLKTLQPNNADYHYKCGGILAMIAKQSNKFRAIGLINNIEKSFKTAIRLDPGHIEARWALIEFYLQLPGILGGSESKATKYAKELAKLSAVDGFLSKGRIAEYFERYIQAEQCYKSAIEIGHSKTCYQKLANLYKNKMNQPEKAKLIMAESEKNNKS